MPRSTSAKPYSSCIFSFLMSCQIVFQDSSTILHSHQQRVNDPLAFSPVLDCYCFYFSHTDSFMVLFYCGFNQHLTHTNHVEDFLVCLFVVCIYSCLKFLFVSFVDLNHFVPGCQSGTTYQLAMCFVNFFPSLQFIFDLLHQGMRTNFFVVVSLF